MSKSHGERRSSTDVEYPHEGRGVRTRILPRRFAGVLLLGGTAAFFMLSGVAAAQTGSVTSGVGDQDLDSAVLGELAQRSEGVSSVSGQRSTASNDTLGGAGTQVNVMREGETRGGEEWAFGSSVIEAPKKEGYYPQGWLFVAKNDGGGWETELEGTPEFAELAEDAPEDVLGEGEKDTFSAQSTAASQEPSPTSRTTSAKSTPTKTGLMLPWKGGTSWNLTGGPHGWSTGYDRPYSSLDFAGRNGDQQVRASGGGKVYRMCSSGRGWVRVYHANGLTTNYYHLWKTSQFKNGKGIGRGAVLGVTGEDVSCGGAAYGRHVHFSLLRGENFIAVHNRILGGWTFKEREAYGGFAKRGATVRRPGSIINNFGPS